MRHLNKDTLNLIKQWEGLRLEAYQDQAGVWTIGYGHTGEEVRRNMVITQAEANKLLLNDLRTAQRGVESLVKVDLTDNQYGAIVSFVFNLGEGRFRSSTLLRKINAGDFDAVPRELAKWNKHTDPKTGKKVPNRGLTNRRAAEIGLWSKGSYVASNTIVAEHDDNPVHRDTRAQGTALAIGAGGASELSETVAESANQIGFFAEYSDVLKVIFGVLIFAGVALAAYGFWKNR